MPWAALVRSCCQKSPEVPEEPEEPEEPEKSPEEPEVQVSTENPEPEVQVSIFESVLLH